MCGGLCASVFFRLDSSSRRFLASYCTIRCVDDLENANHIAGGVYLSILLCVCTLCICLAGESEVVSVCVGAVIRFEFILSNYCSSLLA